MAAGVLVGRGYVTIRPEFEGDWSRTASARGSQAGRSGGKAFAKAFGVGLKGVGVLAGVAVAANLQATAASAALLAPALTTAAAAAGALKIGLAGVGDAFKAAFADTTAQANSAASATRAVESAQRGLANAQRALAQARVDAAERVRDAERDVADAERDLTDAQRDAHEVQGELNEARREAARALEDMNHRLAESRLDEEEAVLRLKDAEKELKEAQAKPGVTPDELKRLQIAYERARLNLTEQRRDVGRLAEDTKKANKAGVEGSEQVLSVKERIAEANRTVADRERALADAQRGVDEARRDGARQVADAQRAVAEAASAVADAQAAAAGQANEFDKAMSKLAPNARSFVNAVKDLAPAWTSMRLSVQNALFAGLDDTVTSLGRTTIPILKAGLTETAGVWNQIAKNSAGAITEMAKSGLLKQVLDGATDNLRSIERVPGQFLTMLSQLSVAAQPAFNRLNEQFAGAVDGISARLAGAFESGALQEGIGTAIDILGQFFTLLGNALGAVQQIMKAAADAGGQIVGVLSGVFAELKRVLALPEMQTALRQIFTAVAQIVATIAPLVGAVVQQLVPLIAMFTPFIQQITTQLGPVLLDLVTTLGTALMPIISALLPVVYQVAAAIVQVVQSVMPLLQPIALLITSVIEALAPALQPILLVITSVVAALVGPLTTVIQALMPSVQLLGEILGTAFSALMPILGPVVQIVGELAGLFAGLLAQALQSSLEALTPLIDAGLTLVQAVLGALMPILPTITGLLTDLSGIFGLILGPVAGLAAELAGKLAPVIADLAPIFAEIAKTLVGGLAQILPVIADVVVILVEALQPLFPLLAEIGAIVITLAGDLLKALLPPLSDLIKAAVDLLVVFAPLLEPLAQLIALLAGVAATILNVLLPPLVRIASFIVTVLAKAVGWLVGVIAGAIQLIVKGFQWLYDVLIGHSILPDIIAFIKGPFAQVFTWIWKQVIKPAWDGIVKVVEGAWKHGIKPVFDLLRKGVGALRDSFKTGVDAIGRIWSKLKDKVSGPVQWVIDVIYNNGIRAIWNTIAGLVGLKKLDKVYFDTGKSSTTQPGSGKPQVLARGGVLPGYTPGRDVHSFYSPTGGRLELSGGEAVMRPEFTRALGVGGINALNAAARTGGVGAVRDQLGFANGGVLHFDKGGVVGDIFGAITDVAKKVGGAVMTGFDLLTSPGKMFDKATGFIRDKLKDAGETKWAQAVARVPLRMLKGLKDYLIKQAGSLLGDFGGKATGSIGSALAFAKAQAGKPYGWGAVGPSAYDCSGLQSAIQNVILGRKAYQRAWATGSFAGGNTPAGWVKNLPAPFRVGITHAGVGHTAGTLMGLNVESRGGQGVVVGKAARGYKDPLFTSWYGFAPSMRQQQYDTGGVLQPGWTLAYNGLGTPEAVLTPGQLSALEAAPGRGGDGPQVVYQIYPRASVLDRRELEDITRHREMEMRVGRGR